MSYSLSRALLWLGAFVVLALSPLGLARVGAVPEARQFAVELGVGIGFLALALLALQFVFSGRIRAIAPAFGMDNILQFHREIGIVTVGLVLAHPIVLITADSSFLSYFDPRVNAPRAVLLAMATLAAVTIAATSIWRGAFRLEYEWWRLLHGGLGALLLGVAVVHAIQVGHYLEPLWKKGVVVFGGGVCGYLLAHTRLVRPWSSRRRPYRVVQVQPERDSSWSMTLEPVGHPGMRFRPGQFAWLTLGDSPLSLQQHPFSFASSAARPEVTFTSKETGDFTERWKSIEPGTGAYLEGPFGSFVPDPDPAIGAFMVMGGIGITPGMGILRTWRDTGERRAATLIYGNRDWENVTFREELEEMRRTMDLRLVHLLEETPADWEGESGFVTRELLARHLPGEPLSHRYFICGPKPMMDITEVALRELGIPWERIYSERFTIV